MEKNDVFYGLLGFLVGCLVVLFIAAPHLGQWIVIPSAIILVVLLVLAYRDARESSY